MIPLNLVIALALVGGGVIQNLKPAEEVKLVEPIAVTQEGEIIEDADIDLNKNLVTVDDKIVEDAEIVTEGFVPWVQPPARWLSSRPAPTEADIWASTQRTPLENPNAFTNLIEIISLLLIPVALCFTFWAQCEEQKTGRSYIYGHVFVYGSQPGGGRL